MEITDLPKNKKIILFDGVCNLCDASVQYVIKHDKKDIFRFVSLQSELGQKILKHIGVATHNLFKIIPASWRDSIYDYVAKNRYKWYGKQDACIIPTPELKSKFL